MVEGSRRLLIVDDERNIRTTLSCAFKDEGFETVLAETAEEALELIEREAFHLMLLDVKLPGMSGLDLLRSLKETGRSIPVIVITAYGTVEGAVDAMRLGAFDVVEKPFTPDKLREVVECALRDRAPLAGDRYDLLLAAVADSLRKRDRGEAMACARKAVGVDPERPEAFNVIGAILVMQGQVARGQDFFRAALAIDPTYAPARTNLASCAATRASDVKIDLGLLEASAPHGDDRDGR